MKSKAITTPEEAIAILLKQFDNKRNLHRMTQDQSRQIALIILQLDARRKKAQTYMPQLRALTKTWFIGWLFPHIIKDLEKLAGLLSPAILSDTPSQTAYPVPLDFEKKDGAAV